MVGKDERSLLVSSIVNSFAGYDLLVTSASYCVLLRVRPVVRTSPSRRETADCFDPDITAPRREGVCVRSSLELFFWVLHFCIFAFLGASAAAAGGRGDHRGPLRAS